MKRKIHVLAAGALAIVIMSGCSKSQTTTPVQITLTPTSANQPILQITKTVSSTPNDFKEVPTATLVQTEPPEKLPGSIAFIAHAHPTIIGILDKDLSKNQFAENCSWCNSLSWSPDGEWIAFNASFKYGDSDQIYKFNVESNEIVRITTGPNPKWGISWSPDGKNLVYIEEGNSIDSTDIVKINSDGSNSQKITYSSGYEIYPVWSPDGKRIAFLYHEERGSLFEIWTMDRNGKNRRKILDPLASFDSISWSPDGESILFVSEYDCGNLLSVNVESSEVQEVMSYKGCVEQPSWSPDGNYIIFIGSSQKSDPLDSANWEISIWDVRNHKVTSVATDQDWRPIEAIWDPLMR